MSQSNDSGLNLGHLEALLACPFCGGTPDLLRDEDSCSYVSCEPCSVAMPAYRPGFEQNAIQAWNRRAALANQPAPTVPAGDALTANLDREKLYGLMMKFRRAREGHITGHADGLTYAFRDVWAYLESAALPAHQPAQEQAVPILYARQFDLDDPKWLAKHGAFVLGAKQEEGGAGGWTVPLYLAAQQEPVAAPQQIDAAEKAAAYDDLNRIAELHGFASAAAAIAAARRAAQLDGGQEGSGSNG